MDSTMTKELVIKDLEKAIRKKRPEKGLICHSDRGSQYASNDYQKLLNDNGFRCSMSRKGNCFDNAPAESFFSSLMKEEVRENDIKPERRRSRQYLNI